LSALLQKLGNNTAKIVAHLFIHYGLAPVAIKISPFQGFQLWWNLIVIIIIEISINL